MKSVLFSLSFMFTILLTMASCQTQGSRATQNHDDVRNEIIYKSDVSLEREVARVIKNASRTQNIQFFNTSIN